ncbi:MAG: hypothetical protein AAF518_26555 [Spirochaetota bacterium]
MGKIIDFITGNTLHESSEEELILTCDSMEAIGRSLEQAKEKVLQDKSDRLQSSDKPIVTVDKDQVKEVFEKQLYYEMQDKVSSEMYSCCNYASSVLTSLVFRLPESVYTIDYISNEMRLRRFKEAGDLTFALLTIFPRWTNRKHRSIDSEDYESMGQVFYMKEYNRCYNEVFYFMSNAFSDVVGIARRAIAGLATA